MPIKYEKEQIMNARERYEEWLSSPVFDEKTKAELREIAGDEAAIRERFEGDLEFGTGGMRGIMGAGTRRMNVYTVRKATQGLANYIIKKGAQDKGVALSFDSRNRSEEFAHLYLPDPASYAYAELCGAGTGLHCRGEYHRQPQSAGV